MGELKRKYQILLEKYEQSEKEKEILKDEVLLLQAKLVKLENKLLIKELLYQKNIKKNFMKI